MLKKKKMNKKKKIISFIHDLNTMSVEKVCDKYGLNKDIIKEKA